jgi:adenosine deaminase
VQTAAEIVAETGITLPGTLEESLVAPEFCQDLADFLGRIDNAIALMQRPAYLRRVARELVEDFAADGVIYGEIRCGPQMFTAGEMSLEHAFRAVVDGIVEGRAQNAVEVGLLLTCARSQSVETSFAVVDLALANRDLVSGIDLAGDEARFHGEPHAPAFRRAADTGLPITVHAGEAASAWSIREALDVLGAERIGHGVRCVDDPSLVERLARDAVVLEMCPRSNVQTRAVPGLAEHPADRLLRDGLQITVNTDTRTTSATSLTREFRLLGRQFGWGWEEFLACQMNSLAGAFVSREGRQKLAARLDRWEHEMRGLTPGP